MMMTFVMLLVFLIHNVLRFIFVFRLFSGEESMQTGYLFFLDHRKRVLKIDHADVQLCHIKMKYW